MGYKLQHTTELESEMTNNNILDVIKISSIIDGKTNPLFALKKLLAFLQHELGAKESWLIEQSNEDQYYKWNIEEQLIKEEISISKDFKLKKTASYYELAVEKPFLLYKNHLIVYFELKEKKYWVGFSDNQPIAISKYASAYFEILKGRFKEFIGLYYSAFIEEKDYQKLETIINNLPQGIVFTDKSSAKAYLNSEALKIFHLSSQENQSIDLKIFNSKLEDLKNEVINKDEVELVGNNMISLNAFPSSFGEDWIWKFDQKVLKVIRKKVEISGKSGELWVFDNVSELYFANERLNSLFRTLNVAYHEINANLTEFQSKSTGKKSITDLEAEESRIIQQYDNNDILGKVTHDLRTPFAKVYTIVQLLLSDNQENLNPQQVERINLIKQVVADGLQIVKGFLDTGNMVLDDKKFKPETIDVQNFVDDCLMPYELLSAKKNIIFITQVMEKNLKLEVDRTYLKRIFDNLVSNAIKFSPFETQINYTVTREDNQVVFSVKDQGPGLTDDDKSRLFKKYQQLSAKPIGSDESTGLGLYIVKTMVDKAGGNIWVESEAGKGADFKVSFPLAQI